MTGGAPFSGFSRAQLFDKVMCGGERPDLEYDDYGRSVRAKDTIKALLARCWDRDPSLRPAASEVVEVFESAEGALAEEEGRQSFLRKSFKRLFSSKDSI